jgi:hypothetical protein
MRLELPGHDCLTAGYMGWSGIENGELLRRAAEAGFDAVTPNAAGFAPAAAMTIGGFPQRASRRSMRSEMAI